MSQMGGWSTERSPDWQHVSWLYDEWTDQPGADRVRDRVVRGERISREVQHRKCSLQRDDRLMRAEMEGQQNGVRGAVERGGGSQINDGVQRGRKRSPG